MLNWLNDSPGFPVSQNANSENREAASPHGYAISPVSRFSRSENEGAAQQQDETANACEKNAPPISQPLPELFPEDVAELDALMVCLCELEPWLAGYLPEMQATRRSMAPANVAESLTQFRGYVREAEARRGAVLGAGDGKSSALEKAADARENARQEREQATGPPLASELRHRHQTATKGKPK
jgi:hypothetical protein